MDKYKNNLTDRSYECGQDSIRISISFALYPKDNLAKK